MQFEKDNEFDDIITVFQNNLQELGSVLHVSDVVNNVPDYLSLVQNYDDFHFFRKVLEDISVLDLSFKDRHIDFIWISVISVT
jgi:hypothetical protein